ncbi:MAG TPA: glutathione S-transferase [Polaromonas sp.]|uniref:glutathione S-transferase family protein n=1 Tax=Polaromonas sp. TaxID=1869339 RepID=UPI002D53B34C|nr:glutathione S-transferase [Polaromonas sp.]HYW55845.1 glutathione S-transferase [Polaromonas sp.]
MLHLWGRISSINVRKVVWTVQELGLTVQRTDAGGQFGIVKEQDYLQKNPNALVPLIEDGEVRIWESNVIVRYLCAKYSHGDFYPAGLPERFAAEQWMDWQQTTFNPAGRNAFIQWIRTPADQRNPALIAQSVAATEALLSLLDAHLADHAFVGGERFTMVDVPLACEMHRWFGLPQPRGTWPNVDRWYQTILARPATRGVLDLQLS